MKTQRKNRNFSPAGERLQEAIYKVYGDNYDSIARFERDLQDELGKTDFKTIQSTISAMMNSPECERWNKKYFLPIERLLNIRIADIIDGVKVYKPSPRGLYEIGTQGKYEDFEWLAEQTDGSFEVIKSYDEWSKSIVDYVYESKNIEGLRYLVEHNFYEVLCPGVIMGHCHYTDAEEHALILLDLLSQDKDPEAKMFKKLFDSHANSNLINPNESILWNENVLRAILKCKRHMDTVCRKPEILPESAINSFQRNSFEREYQTVCASNWLTPLLCYTLKHESEFRDQAVRLLDVSLDIARITETSIGKNLDQLGGSDTSVTTDKGRVLLGRQYVIGIIGEPSSEGEIKDPELKEKALEVISVIGTIRALAKIQTPQFINGKMHLPPINQNPLYRKFIDAAKGHPYLLQKADSNEKDACNCVFSAPEGRTAHGLTIDQWFQVGQALRSIHQIDTGVEGKVFCHGRFYYADFYILPNEDLEYISGYRDVHIGDYEEDLFAAGFLAFNNNYYHADKEQEALGALLEGYGYPKEGFLEKLCSYLISLAKSEVNEHEIRYLMESAAGVLRTMKA